MYIREYGLNSFKKQIVMNKVNSLDVVQLNKFKKTKNLIIFLEKKFLSLMGCMPNTLNHQYQTKSQFQNLLIIPFNPLLLKGFTWKISIRNC